jgi:hypothetical protein
VGLKGNASHRSSATPSRKTGLPVLCARRYPRGVTGMSLILVGSIETRSLLPLTHVLPPISTSRFAHLCRSRPRGSVHTLLPSSLCLDHSHCLVLAPATLAALPSTRAIPDRDVFHVAHPIRSIDSFTPVHSALQLSHVSRSTPVGSIHHVLLCRSTRGANVKPRLRC